MKPSVDQSIVLSAEESEYIRTILGNIDYDPSGSEFYLNEIRKVAYTVFPERINTAINKLKGYSANAVGSIQIDNLPIDELITGSPRHNESGRDFKNGTLTENILVTMGVLTGEPYSIAHEGLELVNNLTPHKENTKDYTGLGSEVELDFHIENAAQAFMPEGDTSPLALILLGVRGEPHGGPMTRISDCRRALEKLSEEDIKQLYGKNFIIRVPYRWRGASAQHRDNTDLSPILSGPISAPRVTVAFYPDMVLAVNSRAKQALDNLYQAVREVSFGVQVSPGRMVLINNSFTLHSRDSFQPSFDENGRANRWVQRVFVARNLWNFRSFTAIQERVFDPNNKASLAGHEKTPSAA